MSAANATSQSWLAVGELVNVTARTGVGMNQPGGVARITMVHDDTDESNHPLVNVRYVLDNRTEKRLSVQYVKPQTFGAERSLRDRSLLHGRCQACGSLREDCGWCDYNTANNQNSSNVQQEDYENSAVQYFPFLESQAREAIDASSSSDSDSLANMNQHIMAQARKLKRLSNKQSRLAKKWQENLDYDNTATKNDDEPISTLLNFPNRSKVRRKVQRTILKSPDYPIDSSDNDDIKQRTRRKRTRNAASDTIPDESPDANNASVQSTKHNKIDDKLLGLFSSSSSSSDETDSVTSIVVDQNMNNVLFTDANDSDDDNNSNPFTIHHRNTETQNTPQSQTDSYNTTIDDDDEDDDDILQSQFIQPEGNADQFPVDVPNLTKDMSYQDTVVFIDKLLDDLETSWIPSAVLKLTTLQTRWNSVLKQTGSLSGEKTIKAKRKLADEASALHDSLKQTLVRRGLDQCCQGLNKLDFKYKQYKHNGGTESKFELYERRQIRFAPLQLRIEEVMKDINTLAKDADQDVSDAEDSDDTNFESLPSNYKNKKGMIHRIDLDKQSDWKPHPYANVTRKTKQSRRSKHDSHTGMRKTQSTLHTGKRSKRARSEIQHGENSESSSSTSSFDSTESGLVSSIATAARTSRENSVFIRHDDSIPNNSKQTKSYVRSMANSRPASQRSKPSARNLRVSTSEDVVFDRPNVRQPHTHTTTSNHKHIRNRICPEVSVPLPFHWYTVADTNTILSRSRMAVFTQSNLSIDDLCTEIRQLYPNKSSRSVLRKLELLVETTSSLDSADCSTLYNTMLSCLEYKHCPTLQRLFVCHKRQFTAHVLVLCVLVRSILRGHYVNISLDDERIFNLFSPDCASNFIERIIVQLLDAIIAVSCPAPKSMRTSHKKWYKGMRNLRLALSLRPNFLETVCKVYVEKVQEPQNYKHGSVTYKSVVDPVEWKTYIMQTPALTQPDGDRNDAESASKSKLSTPIPSSQIECIWSVLKFCSAHYTTGPDSATYCTSIIRAIFASRIAVEGKHTVGKSTSVVRDLVCLQNLLATPAIKGYGISQALIFDIVQHVLGAVNLDDSITTATDVPDRSESLSKSHRKLMRYLTEVDSAIVLSRRKVGTQEVVSAVLGDNALMCVDEGLYTPTSTVVRACLVVVLNYTMLIPHKKILWKRFTNALSQFTMSLLDRKQVTRDTTTSAFDDAFADGHRGKEVVAIEISFYLRILYPYVLYSSAVANDVPIPETSRSQYLYRCLSDNLLCDSIRQRRDHIVASNDTERMTPTTPLNGSVVVTTCRMFTCIGLTSSGVFIPTSNFPFVLSEHIQTTTDIDSEGFEITINCIYTLMAILDIVGEQNSTANTSYFALACLATLMMVLKKFYSSCDCQELLIVVLSYTHKHFDRVLRKALHDSASTYEIFWLIRIMQLCLDIYDTHRKQIQPALTLEVVPVYVDNDADSNNDEWGDMDDDVFLNLDAPVPNTVADPIEEASALLCQYFVDILISSKHSRRFCIDNNSSGNNSANAAGKVIVWRRRDDICHLVVMLLTMFQSKCAPSVRKLFAPSHETAEHDRDDVMVLQKSIILHSRNLFPTFHDVTTAVCIAPQQYISVLFDILFDPEHLGMLASANYKNFDTQGIYGSASKEEAMYNEQQHTPLPELKEVVDNTWKSCLFVAESTGMETDAVERNFGDDGTERFLTSVYPDNSDINIGFCAEREIFVRICFDKLLLDAIRDRFDDQVITACGKYAIECISRYLLLLIQRCNKIFYPGQMSVDQVRQIELCQSYIELHVAHVLFILQQSSSCLQSLQKSLSCVFLSDVMLNKPVPFVYSIGLLGMTTSGKIDDLVNQRFASNIVCNTDLEKHLQEYYKRCLMRHAGDLLRIITIPSSFGGRELLNESSRSLFHSIMFTAVAYRCEFIDAIYGHKLSKGCVTDTTSPIIRLVTNYFHHLRKDGSTTNDHATRVYELCSYSIEHYLCPRIHADRIGIRQKISEAQLISDMLETQKYDSGSHLPVLTSKTLCIVSGTILSMLQRAFTNGEASSVLNAVIDAAYICINNMMAMPTTSIIPSGTGMLIDWCGLARTSNQAYLYLYTFSQWMSRLGLFLLEAKHEQVLDLQKQAEMLGTKNYYRWPTIHCSKLDKIDHMQVLEGLHTSVLDISLPTDVQSITNPYHVSATTERKSKSSTEKWALSDSTSYSIKRYLQEIGKYEV